jgi:hypothetical protein
MRRPFPSASARARWHSILILLAALAAPLWLLADEPKTPLRSLWRDQDVVVDGDSRDWSVLTPFADKTPFSIGLRNDGEFLYIVLSSSEPSERMQLAMRGLIVWFDQKAGTKKQFGIKYPVIERGAGGFGGRPGGYGRSGGGTGGGYGGPDRGGQPRGPDFDPAKDSRWARLEVLGPGKDDVRSLLIDQTPGVEVRIGDVEGSLVYELKVPLTASAEHPYAIGAAPGAAIGIGLETPDVAGGPSRSRFGGVGMGGRGGGMGGDRPGGMGGERGGFKPPKPLKVWTTAQLASGPAR